jgi:hypothetical protein
MLAHTSQETMTVLYMCVPLVTHVHACDTPPPRARPLYRAIAGPWRCGTAPWEENGLPHDARWISLYLQPCEYGGGRTAYGQDRAPYRWLRDSARDDPAWRSLPLCALYGAW